MIKRSGTGFLALILTLSVILGAYLGYTRYQDELRDRTVEIVVDLNDLRTMAALEKKPLSPILDEIRQIGITGIGVFEETLSEAAAAGELYYAKGSGISRLKDFSPLLTGLVKKGEIKPDRTYIYIPEEETRIRIVSNLDWVWGDKALRFINPSLVEIDQIEEETRATGLGISDIVKADLLAKGFHIIPRVWNDPHFSADKMEGKAAALKDHDIIIFDGEELLGFPDRISSLAQALKKYRIKYGYIEIIKQYGDQTLRKLMGADTVRVHSVSRDELKKLDPNATLDRYLLAVRERSVRLLYLRPFLPPQITAPPVEYNLSYFRQLKNKLENAGYRLGRVESSPALKVKGWQIVVLGAGVIIGGIFLLSAFIPFSGWLMNLFFILGVVVLWGLGAAGYSLLLQKMLALAAALVFPASAVISTFSSPGLKVQGNLKTAVYMLINIIAETAIGIFIMVGLLADQRFMSGVESFPAVKLALTLPLFIVAAYFLLKAGEGNMREKIMNLLKLKVSVITLFLGFLALGVLAFLVARSGNFVIPVPKIELFLRKWLETLLYVRPRTKEFLVGYPFLMLAAFSYLRANKQWLWLLATVGAIAPVSVFNSFSHIHTPLVFSLIRTLNGFIVGIMIGIIVWLIAERSAKKPGQ